MGFFFQDPTDKASIFKRDLKAAITDGDVEKLTHVLQGMGDLPKSFLLSALEKTIENSQITSTELLLRHGAELGKLSTSIIRSVVYDENRALFKLISDHGADFVGCVPGEGRSHYLRALKHMEKDLECTKLKEEIISLKQELTAAKDKLEGREQPLPAVKNKPNSGGLGL